MQRWLLTTLLVLGLFSNHLCGNCVAKEGLWKKLTPKKSVPADPQGDYALTEEHGPWLIMAMYFGGEQGEAEARRLVMDLRQNHNLPAYYWAMTFQRDDVDLGRGLDDYGSKIRRRYRRGNQTTQHAVLVGHFPSLGDPEAQNMLKRVKTLAPQALRPTDETESAASLANVSKFRSYLLKSNGNAGSKGPMGSAFITRNPLLPKEYFIPTGVDAEVAKWNTGPEFSLLSSPGKYTIKVATFRGRRSLKATQAELQDKRLRKASTSDPLVQAVKNAHLLTMALREKGWEAYEFHDRQESYVAVGSFNEAQQTADGRIAIPHQDAQIIIDTFGATSPNNIFNRPAQQDLALEQKKKQQFTKLLGQQGQVAGGFHPKRFVGLPFDIHPQPIRAPKQSVSAAYARN